MGGSRMSGDFEMANAGLDVTPTGVSVVATTLTAEALEQWMTELPAAQVVPTMVALLDAKQLLSVVEKGLTARMIVDGQVGQTFTVNGRKYGLWGSLKHGWRDIPGLFENLLRLGMTPLTISQAVSELRITDLRAAASSLNGEQRSEALELIEGQRIPKGERGSPRFQIVDEKWISRPLDK